MESSKTYSVFSNLHFLLKLLYSYHKRSILYLLLYTACLAFAPMASLLIPTQAVYVLENGLGSRAFFLRVGSAMAVYGILLALHDISDRLYGHYAQFMRVHKSMPMLVEKSLVCDYANLEANKNHKALGRALQSVSGNQIGIEGCLRSFPIILSNAIGLFLYSGAILIVDFRILLVLVLMLICHLLTERYARNYTNSVQDENSELNRKIYYLNQESTDLAGGKDTRIYRLENWFGDLMQEYIQRGQSWQKKIEKHWYCVVLSDTIFTALRDGTAYLVLIALFFQGKITLAQLTLTFGIISQFSDWIYGLVNEISNLLTANKLVSDYRKVMDMPDTFLHKKETSSPKQVFTDAPEIILKDVSFRYDTDGQDILSHINLTIRPGEKLAIVGNNGAGKTTLIKLLCGFYIPTEGSILINGKPIDTYAIEDYFCSIGVVFQDTEPLSISIVSMVSGKTREETNMERFWSAIKQAGLYEKINSLEQKENTYLTALLDEHGIQLSGGETQKLMLARCIYKDAPFLLLDEPTSALDPLAESAMYQEYNRFTKGKTSLFISHRLASTRFCDRILYLEQGEITEEGTHEELLRQNGKYAAIYNIQSHYYK